MKPIRPRILHCVTHLSLGGAERVALDLARGLQAEFEPAVLAIRGTVNNDCGASLAQELRDAGIPFFSGLRVPTKLGGLVTGAWAVKGAIKTFQPNLVHVHTEIPEAAVATYWQLARPTRTALVRTIHSSGFWEFWRELGIFCERALGTAAAIGVSDGALKALAKLRHDAGTKGGPTVRIYNGVSPAPRTLKTKREGSLRVVYGGRLEDEKGADLLPAILARTPTPAGGAVFDVFGEGKHWVALSEWAKQPPKGWHVRVNRPRSDFRELLVEYDIALIPSRFEGFGLVAVEALLAGLRVVGTDCQGLTEVLTEEHPWRAKTGDPLALANALGLALADAQIGPYKLRPSQTARLASFNLASSLEAHAAFYRSLL